jgi:uncharacterized protein (DUF924 family)
MRNQPDTPEAVLAFWFGPLDADGLPQPAAAARWFAGGEAFDQEIRERFAGVVEHALAGGLEAWTDAPRALLALLIVLDQFPRNLFRGDARAFAGDRRALGLARDAVDAGWWQRLQPVERLFLYLPFEHAEAPAEQELCCALIRALLDDCPGAVRSLVAGNLEYAERHRSVIERFGRFPARNAALGRASTPAERAFLSQHPSGF